MLKEWRAADAERTVLLPLTLTDKQQCTDPGCTGLNEPRRAMLSLHLLYSFPTWLKCSESEEAYVKVGQSPVKMPMPLRTAAVYKEATRPAR
uniref:Uncharacterized protein n=1 Tax=Knipowitschia caucasica TaxID=637954 RepID=A0AAV2LSP0_KNICA